MEETSNDNFSEDNFTYMDDSESYRDISNLTPDDMLYGYDNLDIKYRAADLSSINSSINIGSDNLYGPYIHDSFKVVGIPHLAKSDLNIGVSDIHSLLSDWGPLPDSFTQNLPSIGKSQKMCIYLLEKPMYLVPTHVTSNLPLESLREYISYVLESQNEVAFELPSNINLELFRTVNKYRYNQTTS